MLPPHRMLQEIVASLREVIAPAIPEPYPKTQAYMAAVILEIVARSLEERRDLSDERERVVSSLFADLRNLGTGVGSGAQGELSAEARIAALIVALDADRDRLGEGAYAAAKQRVRRSLRELLDQDLRIAKGED